MLVRLRATKLIIPMLAVVAAAPTRSQGQLADPTLTRILLATPGTRRPIEDQAGLASAKYIFVVEANDIFTKDLVARFVAQRRKVFQLSGAIIVDPLEGRLISRIPNRLVPRPGGHPGAT